MAAFPIHKERGKCPPLPSTLRFPLIRHCAIDFDDPFDLYGRVTGYAPHSFFLEHDAPIPGGGTGRFSYLACDPVRIVKAKGGIYESFSPEKQVKQTGDPFAIFQNCFMGQAMEGETLPPFFPFQGGAIGCLSYDLARQFDRLPEYARDDLHFPDLYFMFVETFVVVDHQAPGVWLVFSPSPERLAGESHDGLYREGESRLSDLEAKMKMADTGPLKSRAGKLVIEGEQSSTEYMNRVRECQQFIAAGDIYQANISHRFLVKGMTHGISGQQEAGAVLYRQLRKLNPSPHSAFVALESEVLICNSPERLVRLSGGVADMRPIAGTRPRGTDPQGDRRLAEELLSSPKERAEHLMLVDLARNDLGRVCDYGSVKVNEFMTVERYSHVMHVVSQISGRLRGACNGFDLIRAVFPGGTITGVPKIHCMELIERLEPVRRGIYTGSIGCIGWNGYLDFNIVIRTLLLTGGRGYLQVGAGIVADSDPGREYEETLHKAAAFFQVLKE